MANSVSQPAVQKLEEVFRKESRRVYATLVRLLGDFELAEEALHEALAVAAEKWPSEGIPAQPRAWLISTGRHKAIDVMRRHSKFKELQPELLRRAEDVRLANEIQADHDIADDRLRLIFTCCHPAIDPLVRVPLTLREVCGLTTEEIAHAFLVASSTMAQRIVRGKAKIRDARIPYVLPSFADLPERIDAVLGVIYLVFNEGYCASTGESLTRTDLSAEAIRLGRLLLELLPDTEVMGLLALMLLHESRRPARLSETGDLVLLEDQDRSLWNHSFIEEGKQLVRRAMSADHVGVYTLQAAISAVHADATIPAETDWSKIVSLYDLLQHANPSPVIELNRAVAVAMSEGPAAGLELVDAILRRGELTDYQLAHSTHGELLRRLGRIHEARAAFERALLLAKQSPERRFLEQKLEDL